MASELFDLGVDLLGAFFPPGLFVRTGQDEIVLARAGQKRLEAVVILLRNRIVLVVVASSAADAEPEKRGADDIDALGQHFVAARGDLLIAGVTPNRPEPMKAGGDARLVPVGIHLVAGQLLGDKLVVGLVLVERADDIVAISPSPRQGAIEALNQSY